jgi:hypothetical protein
MAVAVTCRGEGFERHCRRSSDPKTPLILQPLFQGAVVLAIGAVLLAAASARRNVRGVNLQAIVTQRPIE